MIEFVIVSGNFCVGIGFDHGGPFFIGVYVGVFLQVFGKEGLCFVFVLVSQLFGGDVDCV